VSTTDLESRLRALLDERKNYLRTHTDYWQLINAAAAVGAERAYSHAADLFQERDCDADWDNGPCPEYLEDHEKCTPCLVEHQLRALATNATKPGGG
jgi:hypothetical protein